ncbi:MAG: hypothetical protein M3250_01245 [Thermoproteota archaeon]|nr:hypothetical protein [Thermoproteota archaeon]
MQVWEDKAYALYFLKRYCEANECLDKALSLSSSCFPNHFGLCIAKSSILDKLGRHE